MNLKSDKFRVLKVLRIWLCNDITLRNFIRDSKFLGLNSSMKVPLNSIQTSSVQHIGSTQGSHLFSTLNPSVQHKNQKGVLNRGVLVWNWGVCGTEGFVELRDLLNWGVFRSWTEGFRVWNWGVFGLKRSGPFIWNWCVELRGGCGTEEDPSMILWFENYLRLKDILST